MFPGETEADHRSKGIDMIRQPRKILHLALLAASLLALGTAIPSHAATYTDSTTTNITGADIGKTYTDGSGNTHNLGVKWTDYDDPTLADRSEDALQFSQKNLTINNATVNWKTIFGERGKGNNQTISLTGTNKFDNQGIYFGSRSGERSGGFGGDVTLTMDGNNEFTQRVIIGGEGGYGADTGVTGRSSVTISSGINTFNYNKENYGPDKYYGHEDAENGYIPYTDGSTGPKYHSYDYWDNYYGVYLSAIGNSGVPGGISEGDSTKGAHLTIDGGHNTFNVMTAIGGGYDLTPYCSVQTSSDDNDVVWGGANEITINDGINEFAGRTFFGAAGSTTRVDFNGESNTAFTGKYISDNMDRAEALREDGKPGNSYRGGDLPYVFFGGKTLTSQDSLLFQAGTGSSVDVPLLTSNTSVNFNGTNDDKEVASFMTTAFFGGADERWLAGDQTRVEDGETTNNFYFGWNAGSLAGTNATRHDDGVANVTLNGGTVTVGNVNTTPIVATRSSESWEYDIESYQSRYEQVRLIGTSEGSTFTTTGGTLKFQVATHDKSSSDYQQAVADGYTGYFTELSTEVENPVTQVYEENTPVQLESGMIAFDSINISADTQVKIKDLSGVIATQGQSKDFYTNPVLVDTTGATAEKDTYIDLSQNSGTDSPVIMGKTEYDYYFYKVIAEDVDPNHAAEDGIQTNQVRLHIVGPDKPIEDYFVGNMEDNTDTVLDIIKNKEPEDLYEQIDDIISDSTSAEEVAERFDQLVGATYGDLAAAKVQHLSAFNLQLSNKLLGNDGTRCDFWNCGSCEEEDGSLFCPCIYSNRNIWGSFHADGGKVDMHRYYAGYDSSSWGVTIGFDWYSEDETHMGFFFDYTRYNVESSAKYSGTYAYAKDYTVGAYGKFDAFFFGGYNTIIASVSFTDVQGKRWGLEESSVCDTTGAVPCLFYEHGWQYAFSDRLTINPFAGLQFVYYSTSGFMEDSLNNTTGEAGVLGIRTDGMTYRSLHSNIGVRTNWCWFVDTEACRSFNTNIKTVWIHELLDEDPSCAVTIQNTLMNIRSNSGGRDWADLGLGLDFKACNRLSFNVDYDLFLNGYTLIHTGMASMTFAF